MVVFEEHLLKDRKRIIRWTLSSIDNAFKMEFSIVKNKTSISVMSTWPLGTYISNLWRSLSNASPFDVSYQGKTIGEHKKINSTMEELLLEKVRWCHNWVKKISASKKCQPWISCVIPPPPFFFYIWMHPVNMVVAEVKRFGLNDCFDLQQST